MILSYEANIESNGTKQWSVFSGFDPNVTLYDDDPNFVEIMRESTKTADEYPTVSPDTLSLEYYGLIPVLENFSQSGRPHAGSG